MNDILGKLAALFPPDRISWRVGSTNRDKTKGMALAYLDARDVQDRLNDVCGVNWQCEHIVSNAGTKVTCRIGVKFGDEWVWRSNGAGETDYEADKGSYSDSFKRAAVLFGVGRYLYDLSAPWVEIEPMGKSFKIKESELPKLMRLLGAQKVETAAHVAPDGNQPKKKDPLAPWKGPLTKTDLMKKLRQLTSDLALCEDESSLDGCLSGYQGVIEQLKIDVPEWYDGEAHDGFTPLKQRIEDRRAIITHDDPTRYLRAG